MRSKTCAVLLLLSVIAAPGARLTPGATAGRPDTLYLVKKIYLPFGAGYENSAYAGTRKIWLDALKEELTRAGFSTTGEAAGADATLVDVPTEWVTLDGPQPDPPKYSYKFELVSSDGRRLWKKSFDVRSRLSQEEVNRQAAKKMAAGLCRDWLKSARKAGVAVARNCE